MLQVSGNESSTLGAEREVLNPQLCEGRHSLRMT